MEAPKAKERLIREYSDHHRLERRFKPLVLERRIFDLIKKESKKKVRKKSSLNNFASGVGPFFVYFPRILSFSTAKER
jgi:hypothetical protein